MHLVEAAAAAPVAAEYCADCLAMAVQIWPSASTPTVATMNLTLMLHQALPVTSPPPLQTLKMAKFYNPRPIVDRLATTDRFAVADHLAIAVHEQRHLQTHSLAGLLDGLEGQLANHERHQ